MNIQVMKAVWGRQEGYIALPTRKKKVWEEHFFKYPQELAEAEVHLREKEADGWDTYWCLQVFSEPRRVKEKVLPTTNLLWADLDPVDPESLTAIYPSIAWKSSDDRYQAIWLLDKPHEVYAAEQLNKKLTYKIGADKGGWDITQVLRVPGSTNYKYAPPQKGEVLWAKKLYVPASVVEAYVEESALPSAISLLKKYELSPRILDLLNTDSSEVVEGERSDRLWELECCLIESGVPVLTTITVIKECVWNKFKGRRDENEQIYKEVLKAEEYVKSKAILTAVTDTDPEAEALKNMIWAVPYDVFISKRVPKPTWLVEDIWQAGTYGMIAGEPKTYKSVMATDLALSVASGGSFLGTYPVKQQGAVLYVQEENGESTVQDRVFKIAHSKGLITTTTSGLPIIDDMPLFFSNNYGIDLTNKKSRELLEQTIGNIEPLLVILDPLYMMLGKAEENSATEVRDILRWLTYIRNTYNCAIVICHHYGKPERNSKGRGGNKIRGTSEFHAWVESALYINATTVDRKVEISREFRAFPSMPIFNVQINLGDPGTLEYYAVVQPGLVPDEPKGSPAALSHIQNEIRSWLSGKPMSSEELKILIPTVARDVDEALRELCSQGLVSKTFSTTGRTRKAIYKLTL